MAKLSRQTKETIKTIIVLVIVGLLLTAYGIYPLNNSDTLFARADIDDYKFNIDSLPPNIIDSTINPNWIVDTFRVEADGLTSLACLYIRDSLSDSISGTVIVIPSSDTTRNSQLTLIEELIKNSYNIITYDQRATGLSTCKYHGFGAMEALDLQELISYLDIHSQIKPPLYIVGTELGADAALLTALEDSRIKKVIAIEPLLTTDNIIETAKIKHNSIWFPFYNSVMFWWYDKNAGFAPSYIEIEDISAVTCPTLIITNSDDEAVSTIVNISDKSLLTLKKNNNELVNLVLGYIKE